MTSWRTRMSVRARARRVTGSTTASASSSALLLLVVGIVHYPAEVQMADAFSLRTHDRNFVGAGWLRLIELIDQIPSACLANHHIHIEARSPSSHLWVFGAFNVARRQDKLDVQITVRDRGVWGVDAWSRKVGAHARD